MLKAKSGPIYCRQFTLRFSTDVRMGWDEDEDVDEVRIAIAEVGMDESKIGETRSRKASIHHTVVAGGYVAAEWTRVYLGMEK